MTSEWNYIFLEIHKKDFPASEGLVLLQKDISACVSFKFGGTFSEEKDSISLEGI